VVLGFIHYSGPEYGKVGLSLASSINTYNGSFGFDSNETNDQRIRKVRPNGKIVFHLKNRRLKSVEGVTGNGVAPNKGLVKITTAMAKAI